METPFGQVLTAMVTPFTAEGELDYGQAWRLARFLIDNGSDGIVVAGTTGESPTLGDHEKVALFKTVVEAVGERGKVIAGTGTYDTAHSVEMSKRAADLGCHGVMAVTPYYSRPPQEGLFRHFSAIADSTGLPVLVYNIPGRTARLIEVETLQRLGAHPNIVATKDAVEDVDFTTKTAETVGDSMAIYSGQDSLTLPLMRVGAIGVVSVTAHLAGPWIARMVGAAAKGDWEEAERLHDVLMPLNASLFLEPNPMPLKGALERVWERVGEPRLPLVPASSETVDAVEQALGKVQQS